VTAKASRPSTSRSAEAAAQANRQAERKAERRALKREAEAAKRAVEKAQWRAERSLHHQELMCRRQADELWRKDQGFVRVPLPRHRPESNGIAERFVETPKVWLAGREWQTAEELRLLLLGFRAYYDDRPASGTIWPASHRTSMPPAWPLSNITRTRTVSCGFAVFCASAMEVAGKGSDRVVGGERLGVDEHPLLTTD